MGFSSDYEVSFIALTYYCTVTILINLLGRCAGMFFFHNLWCAQQCTLPSAHARQVCTPFATFLGVVSQILACFATRLLKVNTKQGNEGRTYLIHY